MSRLKLSGSLVCADTKDLRDLIAPERWSRSVDSKIASTRTALALHCLCGSATLNAPPEEILARSFLPQSLLSVVSPWSRFQRAAWACPLKADESVGEGKITWLSFPHIARGTLQRLGAALPRPRRLRAECRLVAAHRELVYLSGASEIRAGWECSPNAPVPLDRPGSVARCGGPPICNAA